MINSWIRPIIHLAPSSYFSLPKYSTRNIMLPNRRRLTFPCNASKTTVICSEVSLTRIIRVSSSQRNGFASSGRKLLRLRRTSVEVHRDLPFEHWISTGSNTCFSVKSNFLRWLLMTDILGDTNYFSFFR